MKFNPISRISVTCILAFALTSCGTMKTLTSKLKVKNTYQNAVALASEDSIEFLENISVTPGRIYMKKSSGSIDVERVYVKKTAYDIMPDNLTDIEKANWLQLKYSIKMDVAVEEIKNIPLLEKIDEWWGTPYCLGGSSKNCVDCSYFTLDVMKQIYKVDLKRTAAQQYEQSAKIEWNDLKEGDLIFFKTEGRRNISHVGIYLSNNKFAHASTSQGVTISDLADPYWQRRLYSLGRVATIANN